MRHFLDYSHRELEKIFEEGHIEKYRLSQVCGWIFSKRVRSFELMSNMPLPLRKSLSEKFLDLKKDPVIYYSLD